MEKEEYIVGAIFALSNKLQILGDKLDTSISTKQWLLIAVISKCGNPSPMLSEVAKLIGSSRQNVKKMAAILQERGFVSLNKDVEDTRAVRITLTPKCLAHFKGRNAKELQFMSDLFNDFDETLTDGLYQGFVKLAGNIADMGDLNE